MKKLILSMFALSFVLYASGWQRKGEMIPKGENRWGCSGSVGVCYESEDPDDPTPSPGDRIILYKPSGPVIGTLIEVADSWAEVVDDNGGVHIIE